MTHTIRPSDPSGLFSRSPAPSWTPPAPAGSWRAGNAAFRGGQPSESLQALVRQAVGDLDMPAAARQMTEYLSNL